MDISIKTDQRRLFTDTSLRSVCPFTMTLLPLKLSKDASLHSAFPFPANIHMPPPLSPPPLSIDVSLNGITAHSWKARGVSGNKCYTGDWGQTWRFTTSMGTSITFDQLFL